MFYHLLRINDIKKSLIPADLSARDERYYYLTRYHSYFMNYVIHSWDTERVIVLISSPYNGGHRLHLLSLRFQTDAQRRVPQFPSTASQLPAVLCAPGHVYYSLSLHLYYSILNLMRKSLTKTSVGATGFEPATSRPPAVRATKLRHTPQRNKLYQMSRNISTVFSEII